MTTSILMATLARPGWDKHLPTLIEQSVAPDEIIVVIDRPTDGAERDGFHAAWPSVTFLFNEENMGITKSLNRGLFAARGEFVFRADDDDRYRPQRIERQLATFAETGADLIGTWAEGVAAEGSKPYLIRCPVDDAGIKSALLKRNVLIHPSLAFRRESILALGGYDETFVNAQDYALYLAAIRAGLSFAAVPEPLLIRDYGGDSITTSRRYNQLMYSCAARVVHHAHSGDRKRFLSTIFDYGKLAATPIWARKARRQLFALIGRGN